MNESDRMIKAAGLLNEYKASKEELAMDAIVYYGLKNSPNSLNKHKDKIVSHYGKEAYNLIPDMLKRLVAFEKKGQSLIKQITNDKDIELVYSYIKINRSYMGNNSTVQPSDVLSFFNK